MSLVVTGQARGGGRRIRSPDILLTYKGMTQVIHGCMSECTYERLVFLIHLIHIPTSNRVKYAAIQLAKYPRNHKSLRILPLKFALGGLI